MDRLFLVFLFMVIIMTISVATPIKRFEDNNVKEITADNLEESRDENSQSTLTRFRQDAKEPFQELEKRSLVTYSIGSRVPGDSLLAQGSNSETYSSYHDVNINLEHPRASPNLNSGEVISYVEINVSQSADKGNAYIVEGGIGQREIKIKLNIKVTKFYNFLARIYGYRE